MDHQGGTILAEEILKALLVRGLAGDGSSYRQFLEKLSTHLRGYLRRRLASSPADVEDLLQELLLAIHNQRHTYDLTLPLTPWVHAIAHYKLVDFHRRRARNEAIQDPVDEQQPLFTTVEHDAAEARYDILRLLELLPDRQRLPILCVKIEGASVSDAARRTGLSESAVKVGIHRGLKALAAKLRSMT
jgi:RNA polymerase sigma-70 factor (ECF subfamily)